MVDYDPLLPLIRNWLSASIQEIPATARSRIEAAFWPAVWDELTPEQREKRASDLDLQLDPINRAARESIWNTLGKIDDLETQRQELTFAAAPTVAEIAMRKELIADINERLEAAKSTIDLSYKKPAHDTSTDILAVFRSMKNLTPDELTITILGDDDEEKTPGNKMLEFTARKTTRRVSLAHVGMVDLRDGHTLTAKYEALLAVTTKRNLPKSIPNTKTISLLRIELFKEQLGIKGNPFLPWHKAKGWRPRFHIKNNLGAARKRAAREAEERSQSFDESKYPSGSIARENMGADWLSDHDPDGPA